MFVFFLIFRLIHKCFILWAFTFITYGTRLRDQLDWKLKRRRQRQRCLRSYHKYFINLFSRDINLSVKYSSTSSSSSTLRYVFWLSVEIASFLFFMLQLNILLNLKQLENWNFSHLLALIISDLSARIFFLDCVLFGGNFILISFSFGLYEFCVCLCVDTKLLSISFNDKFWEGKRSWHDSRLVRIQVLHCVILRNCDSLKIMI